MLANSSLLKIIFGRLTLDAFPIHEPILVATFIVVAMGGIAVVGAISYFRLWGYLWREWFTSVDHKRIGVMYMVLGIVMLLRGFADALMMRLQQAVSFGGSEGFLPAHHYDQIFTAHGVIMIFFVAMPFVTGLMNYVVPLQIGARDVSFPFLNNFSFWMTVGGAVLIMMSLFVGEFARTGWLAYPPLSGIAYSPDVGMDYYIWGLQVAGVGTTLSGINLVATSARYGLAEILREDTIYYRCECSGFFPRLSHAVISTVTARRGNDGHRFISFSNIAAPYAGTETATLGWYPSRYNAMDGFRMGNYLLGTYAGLNVLKEFVYGGPHTLIKNVPMIHH